MTNLSAANALTATHKAATVVRIDFINRSSSPVCGGRCTAAPWAGQVNDRSNRLAGDRTYAGEAGHRGIAISGAAEGPNDRRARPAHARPSRAVPVQTSFKRPQLRQFGEDRLLKIIGELPG